MARIDLMERIGMIVAKVIDRLKDRRKNALFLTRTAMTFTRAAIGQIKTQWKKYDFVSISSRIWLAFNAFMLFEGTINMKGRAFWRPIITYDKVCSCGKGDASMRVGNAEVRLDVSVDSFDEICPACAVTKYGAEMKDVMPH
jgi:hypothetical protein